MRVLKIELEGVTTSFRYPHFLVGRQPSLPMPPPATVFGHVASALGYYPDTGAFRFAYRFTHEGGVDDYEHTWLIAIDGRQRVAPDYPHPPNVSAAMQPTSREVLFFPRLTLYLHTEDPKGWYESFLHPRYPVLLGRSQDLASYRTVELVDLEQRSTGYYEYTILPWSYRPRVQAGRGVLMPRWINPANRQEVSWARYVVLENRLFHPRKGEPNSPSEVITVGVDNETLWVDPASPVYRDRQRILVWHSMQGEDSENLESTYAI